MELFCGLTITLLVLGFLTKQKQLFIYDERITATISIAFFLGAFILMSLLAKELKNKGIHGIQGIAAFSGSQRTVLRSKTDAMRSERTKIA